MSNEMNKQYTMNDVLPIAERLVTLDKVNPTNVHGVCVYTSHNNSDRHCIAGQICVELGVPVPESNIAWTDLYRHDFDSLTNNFIQSLQYQADSDDEDGNPLNWQKIDIEDAKQHAMNITKREDM